MNRNIQNIDEILAAISMFHEHVNKQIKFQQTNNLFSANVIVVSINAHFNYKL